MTDVTILGGPALARPLAASLRRSKLRVKVSGPGVARRTPGTLIGTSLVVFGWAPGTWPELEASAYAADIPALHAWWTADRAEVGPLVVRGLGPCPVCLAGRAPEPSASPAGALADWVIASAALELQAALLNGVTDLAGASLTWLKERPGLSVTSWQRRYTCTAAECGAPSPLMVADHR